MRVQTILLAGFALAWGDAGAQPIDSCRMTTSAGVDTSAIYDRIPAYLGRAPGQTFLATDTLVRSLTVWRAPLISPNESPMKLWITETDSTGMPLTLQIVFDGPVLVVPTDVIGVPVEVRYDFQDPVVLPHPGRYAFFVQQYLCDGFFDLYKAPNQYHGGQLWRTFRGVPECELRTRPEGWPEDDLVFTIEFCRDPATPVLRRSWGQIKTRYR